MEKIKSILKDYKLYIFFLVTIVFFGMFAKLQFATDTYFVFAKSTKETVEIFLTSGRFLSAIWYAVTGLLRLGNTAKYTLSFIMAIVFCTLAQYKLNTIIKKFIKNDLLTILISILIIINPFSIEYFMYLEKGVLLFAIFLAICAVEQFVKYLECKENNKIMQANKSSENSQIKKDEINKCSIDNKKAKLHLLFSGILMLLVTFTYQGILAIYISISAIFVIKYSKNIKEFILNNIAMFLCYGVPAVINLLIIRIFFSNFRVSGSINLLESFKKIIEGSKNMLCTYNILPKYFFLIMIMLAILISLIIMIKNKKINKIFGLVYVIILNVLITLVPFIMQDTETIWFVSRSSYAFASLFGLIILFTCVNIENEDNLRNILFNALCIIFIIIQFVCFNKIEIDHYNLNYTDKMNALEIGKRINDYQQETGIEITKISIYLDKSHLYTYQDIFSSGDINISGFGPNWSDVEMINYFNGLKLERVENSDKIQEKFEGKDWDNFNISEQVMFEGDTVHICKF